METIQSPTYETGGVPDKKQSILLPLIPVPFILSSVLFEFPKTASSGRSDKRVSRHVPVNLPTE